MTENTIYYIATKSKTIETITPYFREQSYALQALFDNSPTQIEQITYLMILEPLQIELQQYAVAKIWKRWLYEHAPKVKLIVSGYSQSLHSNFLNLLRLPDDISEWLGNINPVEAFGLEYAGAITTPSGEKKDTYADPWERFLPVRGIDMVKQMARFLDGHDKHYGFNSQLSRIRKELTEINLPPEQIKLDEKKKTIKKEWELLDNRWQFYHPKFNHLPFQDTRLKIDCLLKKGGSLENTLKTWAPDEIESVCEQISELITKVNTSLDPYVHPEYHW
ncbi:MAG TPA: hypothetical protein PKA00_07915 [Saprospiraceae bacterium]|nr:hypothetical protein [Saprospiraceae bacterium]HMQ82818.1 hypothetical protein [Saprospiraceae bacterium]